MRIKTLLFAISLSGFLIGCGETPQVVNFKQGKYQGKPDTRPWDNAPGAEDVRGVKWTQGNRDSWETAIKARQLTQHEDRRLYP